MQPSNSHPPHRSLRHFPRLAPSGGLGHSTLIIIIAVSASVLGLLSIFIWRFLARSLRPKSAPLPPRQSLVHQRELQLVAFAEYKDAIVPQVLADGSYIRETDEGTLDSSRGIQLHPPSPQFMPSHTPPNGSYSSLPSSNDDCSPSSGAATPTTRFSMSTSPTQSIRPAVNRSGLPPRPLSVVSTNSRVSRQSIRGAPHAPHNNVQIMLPAPLAPCLYKETASDGPLLLGTWTRNSTYSVRDNWRRSLADSWVPVGQDCLSDSEPMERQHGRDSIERPTRLIRRMFAAFSTISILDALSPKEDPPRGYFYCEVDPTRHRSLVLVPVRLRGCINSRKTHIPQCRAYLLNLRRFLLSHRQDH